MSISTIRGRDSKSRIDIPKLLKNSMEQRPSEGNSRSPGQEMSRILWKTHFLCHAYRNPPLVPVLHLTTTNLRPPTVFTSYSNISFPSVPRLETALAQCLRCCATNRKVAGSIPFGVIKSFRSHYDPGIDAASNRNEYQEHFLGIKAAGA